MLTVSNFKHKYKYFILQALIQVSASVNLPLHHVVQKFSSGTGSAGWCRKKGPKTVVVVMMMMIEVQI